MAGLFALFVFQLCELAQKTILTRDFAGTTCSCYRSSPHPKFLIKLMITTNWRFEITSVDLESWTSGRSAVYLRNEMILPRRNWLGLKCERRLSGLSYLEELQRKNGSINEDFHSYRLVCFTQSKGMYHSLFSFDLKSGKTCRMS